jgi:hypothetical protein
VISIQKHSGKTTARQQSAHYPSEPNKITGSTHFDFHAQNLTAYGGLLPVAAMLEKLGFEQLIGEIVTLTRATRSMPPYRFVLAMILAIYIGFSRLNHLRFLQQEPMLTGLLHTLRLPPQCTFWRFLASLHGNVARQLLDVQRQMRQRVWEAANVRLRSVTLDTDTTVHTLFGHQMGGRIGDNPNHKGKKSYQPILTFLAETREYVGGELRNGDRPSGAQIARHLKSVFSALPAEVQTVYARADSGFYCKEAVEAYEAGGARFLVSARKTSRLIDELKGACWKRSRFTDAEDEAEFRYQPQGWEKPYRFIALRYRKKPKAEGEQEPEQYQLFETPEYRYRVFVTNMADTVSRLVWFYNQRAGAENLIKEANNDAGLTAHPSARWAMNCVHFQLAMVAYNLNCWLMLFNREPEAKVGSIEHTTLATSRLRFLFLAAKIWRHAGRLGVSYSDHYAEKGIFQRLMARLRGIRSDGLRYGPVVETALTG